MLTRQPIDSDPEDRSIRRVDLNALIGRIVVRSLGSPADMLKVQVSSVGSDRYRVNILIGRNLGSARVGDSFFLTADEEGNILTSSPEIARLY
jgi:hypothetical protein